MIKEIIDIIFIVTGIVIFVIGPDGIAISLIVGIIKFVSVLIVETDTPHEETEYQCVGVTVMYEPQLDSHVPCAFFGARPPAMPRLHPMPPTRPRTRRLLRTPRPRMPPSPMPAHPSTNGVTG